MGKTLIFVNQQALWRILIPGLGLIIFFAGILFFSESSLGKVLQSLGMLLAFLPYFIPFKFNDVVRFSKKGLNFKLKNQKRRILRISEIKNIEAFDKYLIIWKSKKKSIKINITAYNREDVNRLMDLMQPTIK